MPEAAPAAVAPTPTTHPNAPQTQPPAQPQTQPPAQGATSTTPPPTQGTPDITTKYKTLETEHQKKVREHIVERRKWESERKAFTEKAQRLEALEKREQAARLNPPEFLKSIYGDNWHEVLTEAKVNGVPPAQLIQQEMAKLREEFDTREKTKAKESAKRQAEAKQQAEEQARQTIFGESIAWYKAKQAEYPLLAKLGAEPVVARTLAQRIESEFHKTGKILTTSEVADMVEGEVLEWVKEAGKHEKYKAKLQPNGTSSTVATSPQQQGSQQTSQPQKPARRSLTNDITGSTSPATPPMSEKERRERAIAAFEAARRKG